MGLGVSWRWRGIAWALPASALLGSTLAIAEPVIDQALSGAQLFTAKGCAILKIGFNLRIRYASHFPLDRSDELRIAVRPLDRAQASALVQVKREAARVPNGRAAGIRAIEFDVDQPSGPVLRIQFEHPVYYQVGQRSDFESIVVAIAGKAPSPSCKPEFPAGIEGTVVPARADALATAVAPRPKERPAGKTSEAALRTVAASMDEGRAALRKSNYRAAIQLFTKVLKHPENEYSAEAQEFLGLAQQKGGQLAQARAEYEDYLRRYPKGEGHERVRQRLDGILTAQGEPVAKLRAAKDRRSGAEADTWTMSGSLSQFYIRDDSFRTIRDPSRPPVPNEDPDAHRVHQNTLLSGLDLFGSWATEGIKTKFRFSGTEEHSFAAGDNREIVGVAALYAETSLVNLDVTSRLGRQTRNTGGVLGRFDGGVVSWQATPAFRFNAVGGSPALSRKDAPFKDDKYFYGASVDFRPAQTGFEATLFAVEQRDRTWLDRQAVGAELRYFDPNKSAFATVDYDIHFRQLNAAIFSGSWTLLDKSTLYGTVDYRKTPYLSAWTALQGQPFLTLYDMLRFRTKQEIDQFAIDRTATYKSAMVGFTRPITDKLQIGADATAVNLSGTVSSGGIDAMPSAGNEFYYSTQLIGTGWFKDGDMYIAGFRFADLPESNLYVLDFNARYPLVDEFRVNPRLRLGYRKGTTTDLKEYTLLPSLLLNYYWTKDLSFELELGTKWTAREQAGIKETTTELFVTVGFRYDFYADKNTPFLAGWRNGCAPPGPCR